MQTIVFSDFFNSPHTDELLDVPSHVVTSYITVGGISATVIGLVALEYYLAKRGKHVEADRVKFITKYSMPVMFVIYLLYLVFVSLEFVFSWGA